MDFDLLSLIALSSVVGRWRKCSHASVVG